MKKILSVFLLSMVAFIAINTNVQAADGDIELYPYDQEACLLGTVDCTRTKLGDANWDLSYNGHNYNVVRGNARYVVDFDDANSDGMYDVSEYPSAAWSSFGGVFFNDTASEAIISTVNLRGDTSNGSTPRIWVYYDENGDVAMFEDNYINKYDIFNEGDAMAPNWRFATTAEMDILVAAELVVSDAEAALSIAEAALAALTVGTPEHDAQLLVVAAAQGVVDAAELALAPIAEVTIAQSLIRIKTDDVDPDGYVLEPLASLKWSKVGAVLDDMDVTNDSDIIADNPDYVVIPAGWTVFYFGYLDRSGDNQKTLDYTGTFPAAMTAGDTAAMEAVYTPQPGWFTGITALDDDPVSSGVQVIVEYNGVFNMPTTVGAEWLDMFDDMDMIQNMEMPLDFTAEISDDSGVLETLTYTWNATTEMYDLSAEQTVVDSSEFGKGYTARFETTTPEGDMTEATIEIAVGVLPPTFSGVEDRYGDEGVFFDVLGDVTADNGYGMDITDSIMISYPTEFNPYSPTPGMYQVDLEFSYHIHIPGIPNSILLDGVEQTWDGVLNPASAINTYGGGFMIFTDAATFAAAGSGWGSVMVLVGADGLVDESYDRYDWSFMDSTGVVIGDAVLFAAWQAGIVIEEGGFVIAAHGTPNGQALRDTVLAYDAPVSYTVGVEDFDTDIVRMDSFMVTIDDLTNPTALVVNDEYMIQAGAYSSIDDAILANVVALDNYDMPEDLAIYVSDNGGLMLDTAGTYTVEVTVEDMAGNATMVEFDVMVVAAPVILTAAEVQALIDAAVADAVADLLDEDAVDDIVAAAVADALTEADVQALIDDALAVDPDTGCGSSLAIGSSLVGLFALFGGAGLFFIRKRK